MYSKMLLVVFIFITVWMGAINVTKIIYRNSIPWGNLIIMALGITGIIAYFI